MRATQARVAVLGVLGLLAAGAAAVPAASPAARGQLIPPLHYERAVVDPSAGAAELVAWSQAEHDGRVRAYLAGEHQRQLQAAADAQRVADAARAAQRAARSATAVRGDGVWSALARCESGGNPASRSADGRYTGAFQFADATWHSLGMGGQAADHPYAVQLAAAQRLQARSGWGQWPRCARRLGLR